MSHLVLNLDHMYYNIWHELFEIHCNAYDVSDHLEHPLRNIPEYKLNRCNR